MPVPHPAGDCPVEAALEEATREAENAARRLSEQHGPGSGGGRPSVMGSLVHLPGLPEAAGGCTADTAATTGLLLRVAGQLAYWLLTDAIPLRNDPHHAHLPKRDPRADCYVAAAHSAAGLAAACSGTYRAGESGPSLLDYSTEALARVDGLLRAAKRQLARRPPHGDAGDVLRCVLDWSAAVSSYCSALEDAAAAQPRRGQPGTARRQRPPSPVPSPRTVRRLGSPRREAAEPGDAVSPGTEGAGAAPTTPARTPQCGRSAAYSSVPRRRVSLVDCYAAPISAEEPRSGSPPRRSPSPVPAPPPGGAAEAAAADPWARPAASPSPPPPRPAATPADRGAAATAPAPSPVHPAPALPARALATPSPTPPHTPDCAPQWAAAPGGSVVVARRASEFPCWHRDEVHVHAAVAAKLRQGPAAASPQPQPRPPSGAASARSGRHSEGAASSRAAAAAAAAACREAQRRHPAWAVQLRQPEPRPAPC
eukprot:TRINITY_DN18755_c0_g1_i2.p1 TRINITY_DN18755_c0_g1~~TRINITY_DN18755_c0_g1_i2.p1  ORF type:complete len:506 (+),score=110.10 TRINITY_DN18755_c0_g1_i2:73-1518(+)